MNNCFKMTASYLVSGTESYSFYYPAYVVQSRFQEDYHDRNNNVAITSFLDDNNNDRLDTGELVSYTSFTYDWTAVLIYSGLIIGPNSDPLLYSYFWDEGTIFYNYYIVNTSGASLDRSTLSAAQSIILCLLPATLIKLANGNLKRAGDLVPGELVATPAGPQAIKFAGKTTRNLLELRATGRMPIRIDAGALGDLGPDPPIYCTPSHAFHIKGCLVEAQALINGSSIVQLEEWDSPVITYVSIELEHHQLVWANGLLTKTYYATVRDNTYTRESWDNYFHYQLLYGPSQPMQELELPRIAFERQLPAEIRSVVSLPNGSSPLAQYTLSVPA